MEYDGVDGGQRCKMCCCQRFRSEGKPPSRDLGGLAVEVPSLLGGSPTAHLRAPYHSSNIE
ncbi:hypothetical protein E2C01_027524 [Portunus trituberculatus]|uniref:Uncharacterized protein n=1 Tax=Portunus trituberculatus TaxID=210409 RepID=A0A5B7EL30_PORTR|nr:hypothetical protein [Portunus trituberculatus]